LAGAVFPLFATYMFNALKINYSLTLLGAVAAVMSPIPLIFYKYGPKIRAKSKFAPTSPAEAKKLAAAEAGEEPLSEVKGDKNV
jgi:DHA1 family multidrug resistance protein-like MFS transporter